MYLSWGNRMHFEPTRSIRIDRLRSAASQMDNNLHARNRQPVFVNDFDSQVGRRALGLGLSPQGAQNHESQKCDNANDPTVWARFHFLDALHAARHVDDTSNLTLRNELYAYIFADAE